MLGDAWAAVADAHARDSSAAHYRLVAAAWAGADSSFTARRVRIQAALRGSPSR